MIYFYSIKLNLYSIRNIFTIYIYIYIIDIYICKEDEISFHFLSLCINMSTIFRKISKGLE